MDGIEEVRKYFSGCSSAATQRIGKLSNYSDSGSIKHKVEQHLTKIRKLNIIMHTIEVEIEGIFLCIRSPTKSDSRIFDDTSDKDGPNNMKKLIDLYLILIHKDRIGDNQPIW